MCCYTICGFSLALFGLFISFITLLVRKEKIERPIKKDDIKWFKCMLLVSIVSVIIACIGFGLLTRSPRNCANDYNPIIKILALLSAGIIAGFYSFSFTETHKGKKLDICLSNAVGICFNATFYVLFGAVSYYIGKSTNSKTIGDVSYIVPLIMGFILLGNTLFDYWDYNSYEEDHDSEKCLKEICQLIKSKEKKSTKQSK